MIGYIGFTDTKMGYFLHMRSAKKQFESKHAYGSGDYIWALVIGYLVMYNTGLTLVFMVAWDRVWMYGAHIKVMIMVHEGNDRLD